MIAVSRIRLTIIRNNLQILNPQGTLETLAHARIRCTFLLGNDRSRLRDGMVDTGSKFSLFPESVWKPIEDQIEWIGSQHFPHPLRVAGGKSRFRFGRVRCFRFNPISIFDYLRTPLLCNFPRTAEHCLASCWGFPVASSNDVGFLPISIATKHGSRK